MESKPGSVREPIQNRMYHTITRGESGLQAEGRGCGVKFMHDSQLPWILRNRIVIAIGALLSYASDVCHMNSFFCFGFRGFTRNSEPQTRRRLDFYLRNPQTCNTQFTTSVSFSGVKSQPENTTLAPAPLILLPKLLPSSKGESRNTPRYAFWPSSEAR